MKKKNPFTTPVLLLALLAIIFILWQVIWTAVKGIDTKQDLLLLSNVSILDKLRFLQGYRRKDESSFLHHQGYSVSNSLLVGYNRSLPDARHVRCQHLFETSNDRQPSVSVIITYQEVDRSVLLRNLASILQRSKPIVVTEIIVVDDGSSDAEGGQILQQLQGVKVIRNEQAQGRGNARVQGASLASGEIIVFVDSLSEMNVNWLSPLLHRVMQSPKSLVVPVFDTIDHMTFEYKVQPGLSKGGFDWSLQFRWVEVPKADFLSPIRSPLQSGAVFAVRKDFFNWVGSYDTTIGATGIEDIDLSLRAWLCGGQVEIVPCSRVGLVKTFGRPPLGVQHVPFNRSLRGAKKVAELWLDEYKRFFYAVRPSARMQPLSDLSSARKLKEKNKCRSFKWFLTAVYPQLLPLVSDEIAYGVIRQQESCIDLDPGQLPLIAKLRQCQVERNSQEWSWRKKGIIVSNGMCLTSDLTDMHGYVVVQFCKELPNQEWYRNGLQIVHRESGLCLDSVHGDLALVISDCVKDVSSQAWHITSEMNDSPAASAEHDFTFSEDKTLL